MDTKLEQLQEENDILMAVGIQDPKIQIPSSRSNDFSELMARSNLLA